MVIFLRFAWICIVLGMGVLWAVTCRHEDGPEEATAFLDLPDREWVREELNDPVVVDEWREHGVLLVDGRLLAWPFREAVPPDLEALRAVRPWGVEVGEDGRPIVLIPIWHGCG